MNKHFIGLDFGTTCSSIYVYNTETNKPEPRMKGQESEYIPTLIAFQKENGNKKILYGFEAAKANQYIFDVKRMLGVTYEALIEQYSKNGKTLWDEEGLSFKSTKNKMNEASTIEICCDPEDKNFESSEKIAGKYIQWLVETVAEIKIDLYLNIVITIPADFTVNQRKAIIRATKEAGFDEYNITLLHEPSATAISYFQQPENVDKTFNNLLVCDFGGGTFDLSLLSISKSNFDVKIVYGDRQLGGRDFDHAIYQWIKTKCRDEFDFNLDKFDAREKIDLIKKCQDAKEQLSSQNEIQIKLRIREEEKTLILTRNEFNSICNDLIEKSIKTVVKILNESEISSSDVDGVLLVGGSSSIPIFQSKMKEFFGEEKILSFDKNREAIAMGACYLAAMNEGIISTENMKNNYNQRLSHSIGIEITDGDIINPKRGFFSPILKKNTLIPCTQKSNYVNPDWSTSVGYFIHECDEIKVSENTLVDLLIQNIRSAKYGTFSIEVVMSIDRNGILTTYCTCENNGNVSKRTNLMINCEVFKMFVQKSQINQQFLPEYKKDERDCARHLCHIIEAQDFQLED